MIHTKQHLLRLLVFLPFLLACSTTNAQQAHYVDNLNDSGFGSLREAISNAQDDDYIVVNVSGSLSLISPISVTNRIYLQAPMPAHFEIDCSIAGTAFIIATNHQPGAFSVFDGIRFKGASATAINVQLGSVYIGHCVFDQSVGTNGAAIINSDSLLVEACSFVAGTATNGGAIYNEGVMQVQNSTFYDNLGTSKGGAIYSTTNELVLVHNTFYQNDAVAAGGAVYLESGQLDLFSNLFYDNGSSILTGNVSLGMNSGIMTSGGGNFFDSDPGDFNTLFVPQTNDVTNSTANPLLAPNIVTDGFGFRYFPIVSANSPAIDIGGNLPASERDQRRSYRVMQGSSALLSDAGSIEFTPFIVTSLNGASSGGAAPPGSLGWAINGVNTASTPHSIVFNLPGPNYTIGAMGTYFVLNECTIDGYTQPGSLVPGPRDDLNGTSTAIGLPLVAIDGINAGNSANGIVVSGASLTQLRGLSVINFNKSGLTISGFSDSVSVEGMHLGVDETGESTNTGNMHGITITGGASNNYIGNWYHHSRNLISNSDSAGVLIRGQGTTSNFLFHNFIGVDGFGETALPNFVGIHVLDSANVNHIGDSLLFGNLISGNLGAGILLADTLSDLNAILGNFIGTDISGTQAIPNHKGIVIANRSNLNFVGGNLISGNDSCGIQIDTWANAIGGNRIGTDITGTTDLGNGADGIYFGNPLGLNFVGGANPGEGNLISGNDGNGIKMQSANLSGIAGNLIGVSIDSVAVIPNNGHGIFLDSACVFVGIGGATQQAFNIIGGNGGSGIFLQNTNGGHTISGNWIGTVFRNDQLPNLGNMGHGILIDENSFWGSRIGDSLATGGFNYIAHNGLNGITILGDNGNRMYRNMCYNNGGLGIDLGNDGVTGVDSFDFDFGANSLLNAPEITSAFACSNGVVVNGQYHGQVLKPFRLDFYGSDTPDPSGYGEGQFYLGFYTDSTDANGNFTFTTFLPAIVPAGWVVTATATIETPASNSSEFGPAKLVDPLAPAPTINASTTSLCINSTPAQLSATGTVGSIVWSNDNAFTDIIDTAFTILSAFDSAGTFTYYAAEVVNGQCLSGYDSVVITVLNLDDPFFAMLDFCSGGAQPAMLVSTPGGTFTFSSPPSDNATIDASTGLISNATGGNSYEVLYTTPGPCTNTFAVAVNSFENPFFSQTAFFNEACEGDQSGSFVLTGSGGAGNYTYSIDNGATFQTGNTFSGLGSGTYQLVVQDQQGCTATLTGAINFDIANSLNPGPDLSTCAGTPVTIEAMGVGAFSWSGSAAIDDSSSNTPTVFPMVSTMYYATLSTGTCLFYDSVFVTVVPSDQCAELIANAFSPEGDGVNDVWEIALLDGHPENRVEIFNRWGDKLRSYENYNNADVVWDGTFNGTPVASSTYFYTIHLKDTEETFSGWVQVVY